jgi:hypothetical protein
MKPHNWRVHFSDLLPTAFLAKHWKSGEHCEGTFLSNSSGEQKELGFV